jgi:hypothetical protein
MSVRLGTVGTWKFAGEMAIGGHAPQESLPESFGKSSQSYGRSQRAKTTTAGP